VEHRASSESGKGRGGRVAALAAVVVVIVAAAVVVVATTVGRSRPHRTTPTPAEVVASSVRRTLERATVDLSIDAGISTDGHLIPLQGSGALDVGTGTFWSNLTVEAPARTFQEQEVATRGHVYVTVTGGAMSILQITGGPDWVDIPEPDLNSNELGAGNVDPLAQLQLLEHEGAAVVAPDRSSVDGATVSAYVVRPTTAEEARQLQREIRSGTIPPSMAGEAEQALAVSGAPTIEVSVDRSGLLRQVSLDYRHASAGTLDVAITFSAGWRPLTVTPPPSSDVVSYAQFLQDQGSAPGSSMS